MRPIVRLNPNKDMAYAGFIGVRKNRIKGYDVTINIPFKTKSLAYKALDEIKEQYFVIKPSIEESYEDKIKGRKRM